MENKGLLQTKELYQYILDTSVYPRESEFLKELRDATANYPGALMGTAPDAGQLMTLLLDLVNAKKTIEIGVFTGYSLLLTALSIPEDGKAGVEHKIDFVESLALPVLEKLLVNSENEGTFDFAYVDADKVNYWNYHEKLLKLLRVGGIVVYDNTLWGGSVAMSDESLVPERYKASRRQSIEFNKLIAADSRIRLSQVPVGDGSTVCIRLH